MAVPEELLAALRRYAAQDYREPLACEAYAGTQWEELVTLLAAIVENAKRAQDDAQSFAANTAHELRTPITIISGFVDELLDGTVPRSERTQTLSIVSQETKRLNAIVTSMLNLTKLEAGTLFPQDKWFTLNDVIFHTMLMFQSRLEKRGITVEGLDGPSVRVYADPELIGQVVFNLAENAVKFVNDHGTISFLLEETPDTWNMTLRNTGNGIPQEELPKLCERFYQSDATKSADRTGLGLGLDITRRILQLYDAQIFVRSDVHADTEFEIRLPRRTASTDQEKQSGDATKTIA
ncbi:MAG: HAMP domain-containing histidine kinase [Ruminococcus sp.]|nr:HAMP domain-containing histidine kinase [Ruminococcus sp.]